MNPKYEAGRRAEEPIWDEDMPLTLWILGKVPSKKNGWTIAGGAHPRIVTGRDYKAWARSAVVQLHEQMKGAPRPFFAPKMRLSVRVDIRQARRQAIDIDNALGSVFDVLQKAGVIANDYQIEHVLALRSRDAANPRVGVELEVLV